MAMQQSGKGAGVASGSAPEAPLSDEQADVLAASFTPSWDSADGLADDISDMPTALHLEAPQLAAASAVTIRPATAVGKTTLLGTAPQANAPTGAPVVTTNIVQAQVSAPRAGSSSELIDPENILESSPAPPRAAARGASRPTSGAATRPVAAVALPKPAAASALRAAAHSSHGEDDEVVIPKKSSKTIVLVVAGLAVAAGAGIFFKFAVGDDPRPSAQPSAQTAQLAATTAEIPAPPPKVEAPATAAATTTTTATATAAAAIPTTVVAPDPAPVAAGRLAAPAPAEPRPAGGVAASPARAGARQPPATALPTPPAPSPKTPPRAPNGSIVRDNPF
jgi:hypothetical protein